MRVFLSAVLATSVLCTTGLAQSRPTPTNPKQLALAKNRPDQLKEATQQAQVPEGYVIGPEDVLSINVWREQELTARVTVRPDGKIGLPLLNDVQASGVT